MIVEQIRYFLGEDDDGALLAVRREISRIRAEQGLPPGTILVPDGEGGPSLIWQCGYEDESAMGAAETGMMGNESYETARQRIGEMKVRVELEICLADDDGLE